MSRQQHTTHLYQPALGADKSPAGCVSHAVLYHNFPHFPITLQAASCCITLIWFASTYLTAASHEHCSRRQYRVVQQITDPVVY